MKQRLTAVLFLSSTLLSDSQQRGSISCHMMMSDSLHTQLRLISCSAQSPGLQCPCAELCAGIAQLIPDSGHSLTCDMGAPCHLCIMTHVTHVTSLTIWNKAPALAHSCDANLLRNFTQNIRSAVTIDLPNLEPLMLSDEPWHVWRLEIRHKIASSLETSLSYCDPLLARDIWMSGEAQFAFEYNSHNVPWAVIRGQAASSPWSDHTNNNLHKFPSDPSHQQN